jgi:glutamyl-tRNA synthetase
VDEIKGAITMNTADLGDFVIAKNIDEPLFHFAVVVDDFDAGITHVIRGEDHVSNTPRQILIQQAIGAPTPTYAHLPLVMGTDKQKLSKRKGALAMTEYRDLGYLPEAILNMVAMVGWNPGTERELFTMDELIATFDLKHVQTSPAVFNPVKLDWFNREYIKQLSFDEQLNHVKKFLPNSERFSDALLCKLIPIIVERINCFHDVVTMNNDGEFDYYLSAPAIDLTKVGWKGEDLQIVKKHLTTVIDALQKVGDSDWNHEQIKGAVWDYAESVGRGNVLWPVRFSLSNRDKSPDPFTLAVILGKMETISRLQAVCEIIS